MKSAKKNKISHRTYQDKHPEEPTSYDTDQPETATPQQVRENVEPTAQLIRKEDSKPVSE